jgi:glycosyltransferase involved in cell wall biosynthesis
MKVFQVSTWNIPCGIAGYTKGLINGISEHGIECEVLPIDRQQIKYMSRNEVNLHFDSYAEKMLIASPDIIHLQHEFSFFAGSYGLNLSMSTFSRWLKSVLRLKKPVFVTFHTEPTFLRDKYPGVLGLAKKKSLQYLWKSQIALLFNSQKNLHAIVHSKNSRKQFIDSGFKSEKIHIVKQGVTLSHVDTIDSEHKASLKKELGFPENAIVLAMFGFISAYKGYITAIQALELLPKEYYLLIIGMPHPEANDSTFDEIVRILEVSRNSPRSKDLHSRVKLAGFIGYEKLQDYYDVVDINLAPYKKDTNLSSSAAITWALSSGKPVIASNISAFAELNEVSSSLQMVAPEAPGELAYRVKEIITDSTLKNHLVANALKYCNSNQWCNIGKDHIELYTKFVK